MWIFVDATVSTDVLPKNSHSHAQRAVTTAEHQSWKQELRQELRTSYGTRTKRKTDKYTISNGKSIP